MQSQQTRSRAKATAGSGGDPPASPGGSSLAQQARRFAEVARAAYANCDHGAAAEQELSRRRNRSGQ